MLDLRLEKQWKKVECRSEARSGRTWKQHHWPRYVHFSLPGIYTLLIKEASNRPACQGHFFARLSFVFCFKLEHFLKTYFPRDSLPAVRSLSLTSWDNTPHTFIFIACVHWAEGSQRTLALPFQSTTSSFCVSDLLSSQQVWVWLCAPQLNWQQTCSHSKQLEVNGNELVSSVKRTPWAAEAGRALYFHYETSPRVMVLIRIAKCTVLTV